MKIYKVIIANSSQKSIFGEKIGVLSKTRASHGENSLCEAFWGLGALECPASVGPLPVGEVSAENEKLSADLHDGNAIFLCNPPEMSDGKSRHLGCSWKVQKHFDPWRLIN